MVDVAITVVDPGLKQISRSTRRRSHTILLRTAAAADRETKPRYPSEIRIAADREVKTRYPVGIYPTGFDFAAGEKPELEVRISDGRPFCREDRERPKPRSLFNFSLHTSGVKHQLLNKYPL